MVNQMHNKDRLQYSPSKPTAHNFNVSKSGAFFFRDKNGRQNARNIQSVSCLNSAPQISNQSESDS